MGCQHECSLGAKQWGATINKLLTAIVIGVAVAAIIGAAFVFFIISNDDERSFTVTYYNNGNKLLEESVPSGTAVTVHGEIGGDDGQGRFVGWNTKPDMSGKTLLPGSKLKVSGNTSLYAMIVGSGIFVIILPEEQEGFSMTANPLFVVTGGSSILSYSLLPSHTDDELVIAVNGNPTKLDATKRIYLTNITEDQTVTVTGVFDKREHSVSIPEYQVGYVLTSSAERVHHGESYMLKFTFLSGYAGSPDFGIRVNGGTAKIPSSDGSLLIENVMDNHKITVTGVEPIEYSVSSGKNITVLVDGVHASKATVEDIVTVLPNDGYVIPETFNAQVKGNFTFDQNVYRIAGNVAFPSVLKITAGDNTSINNGDLDTIFVCPDDKATVSAVSGYSLPSDYLDKVLSLSGVKYSGEKFSFSNDVTLPSIYRVVFNGYSAVHATLYAVGGTMIPLPQNNPGRTGYYFNGWGISSAEFVLSDLSINPVWVPETHDVYFGPGLSVNVGSKSYIFIEGSDSPPRTIKVKSDEKVVVKSVFELSLPNDFGPSSGAYYRGGYYEVLGDCSFPGVTFVKYVEMEDGRGPEYCVIIGDGYTPIIEPTIFKAGYIFKEWTYFDGTPVRGQITIENKPYLLYASWIPMANF